MRFKKTTITFASIFILIIWIALSVSIIKEVETRGLKSILVEIWEGPTND